MNKKSNKEVYRIFCAEHPEIPLFFQPWWLDVVCKGGDWKVAIEYDGEGKVAGLMPYFQRKKWGLTVIGMPLLTPFLGPWIMYPKKIEKESRIRSFRWEVVHHLIQQLPASLLVAHNCHYSFGDWLPFYWEGYRQTTCYSYILNLENTDLIYKNLKGAVRNSIRKAIDSVEVLVDPEPHQFFEVNLKTFEYQGIDCPYSLNFFLKLDEALVDRKRRRIYLAKDKEGNVHAGAYIVWDKRSAYLLALGTDFRFRNSGAASLLIWRAIEDAADSLEYFDFEGSIIKGVSQFFNAFSGQLQPYHRIYRWKYRWMEALRILKENRL